MKTQNQKRPLQWYLTQWRLLEFVLMADTEFCREMGLAAVTTRRWRREGKLAFLIIDRKAYYRMTDVLPYLSRKTENRNPKNS